MKAIPVSYQNHPVPPLPFAPTTIGSVTVVAADGPPLTVRPWAEADGDNKHISIEFEDIPARVQNQALGQSNNDNDILRLCLHLADARKLTHNLIVRLAQSGDRVAQGIMEKMNDSMEQVRALNDAPVALCNLRLASLDAASFNLCWREKDQSLPTRLDAGEVWTVPLAEPTTTLRQKEPVETLLRVIRKYAELLGILIQMQDSNNILQGIDYKSILDPYNAPDKPTNFIYCLVEQGERISEINLFTFGDYREQRFLNPINAFTIYKSGSENLYRLVSYCRENNIKIRFYDPAALLDDYGLQDIFGKYFGGRTTSETSLQSKPVPVTQTATNTVQDIGEIWRQYYNEVYNASELLSEALSSKNDSDVKAAIGRAQECLQRALYGA
jgi:hypothetical protein